MPDIKPIAVIQLDDDDDVKHEPLGQPHVKPECSQNDDDHDASTGADSKPKIGANLIKEDEDDVPRFKPEDLCPEPSFNPMQSAHLDNLLSSVYGKKTQPKSKPKEQSAKARRNIMVANARRLIRNCYQWLPRFGEAMSWECESGDEEYDHTFDGDLFSDMRHNPLMEAAGAASLRGRRTRRPRVTKSKPKPQTRKKPANSVEQTSTQPKPKTQAKPNKKPNSAINQKSAAQSKPKLRTKANLKAKTNTTSNQAPRPKPKAKPKPKPKPKPKAPAKPKKNQVDEAKKKTQPSAERKPSEIAKKEPPNYVNPGVKLGTPSKVKKEAQVKQDVKPKIN